MYTYIFVAKTWGFEHTIILKHLGLPNWRNPFFLPGLGTMTLVLPQLARQPQAICYVGQLARTAVLWATRAFLFPRIWLRDSFLSSFGAISYYSFAVHFL